MKKINPKNGLCKSFYNKQIRFDKTTFENESKKFQRGVDHLMLVVRYGGNGDQ